MSTQGRKENPRRSLLHTTWCTFQGGGYRATALGFYQRKNTDPLYQERRQSMDETLSKFMSESTKRHEENSNLIKEIQASTDAAIRNQGASIKTWRSNAQKSKIGFVLSQDLIAFLTQDFLCYATFEEPHAFVDPLALMTNVAPQQYNSQSSTNPSSTYVPPHFADNSQLDSGLSPMDNLIENLTNTLALLTQSYKTYLPQTNNQLRTSSNPRNQATVQDDRVVVKQGRLSATTAMENRVALDEEQLIFLAADDCDAFDSDVDEAPTAQTMFMANLSSADPVYDEAGPSYDSDILSKVHGHEEYEMHDDVQLNYVVDSHADYTSNSNMIPYDQYVKDNAMPVIQSNASSVTNVAYMIIYNDMCEPHAQSFSKSTRNIVVDNSLTAEIETYKEQVELYERRARFELTEREQKIDEQLRIVIIDRNIKEETLKKELRSVKMQLTSTINHNKSMVEEVTSLKKDFKQKKNKYLEEFLDMKALKEKVEDKLYKQVQSLQTVHMLCKPKPYYDEQNKVAIGYKNWFVLIQYIYKILLGKSKLFTLDKGKKSRPT
ncbi:hypothetical protein Tco_1505957 [Tanacetum coccineum]